MDEEIKNVDQLLALSYESFYLLDRIPIGNFVMHRDGTVLFWNACLEDWTAIARAQIVGKRIDDFFPHLSHKKYISRLQEVFDEGFTVIFSSHLHPHLIPCVCTTGHLRVQHTIVTAIPAPESKGFNALFSIQDVTDLNQQIQNYKVIQNRAWSEVKQRQAVEEQLRHDRDLLNAILNSSTATITVVDTQGNLIFANQRGEEILGLVKPAHGANHQSSEKSGSNSDGDDLALQSANVRHCNLSHWGMTDFEGKKLAYHQLPFVRVINANKPVLNMSYALQWNNGERHFLTVNGSPLRNEENQITGVVLSMNDITLQKHAADELNLRYRQERLVDQIVQHIRRSLNLREILQTTATEIQKLLQADRVLIYRLMSHQGDGRVMAEARDPNYSSLLEWSPLWVLEGQYLSSCSFAIQATADITTSNLPPDYIEFLQSFEVKARLAIPLTVEPTTLEASSLAAVSASAHLWGWLVIHHCASIRQWQLQEIDLIQRLESQLAVAIYQSQLHQQMQHLNLDLERQVHARTLELQQALTLEATLKRITDKVRDSLDENQILQTVVVELATALEVQHCNTTLYSTTSKTVVLQHQFPQPEAGILPPADYLKVESCFEVYDQLFRGQPMAFCWLQPNSCQRTDGKETAILACPIVDDQGVLGDLWLFKPAASSFSQLEISVVQQVANQCAIAIRQAQLYKASQQQVEELARLNRLKDDFLSTISHELRTPIASIRMALQTLELMFHHSDPRSETTSQADQYFHLLEDECQREAKLIDDLLDLTRLDAGTEPLMFVPIQLKDWLPHIAETFEERMRDHQQQLCLDFPAELPVLLTDLSILERIVVELLTNACKYTPAGETITVQVQVVMASPPDSSNADSLTYSALEACSASLPPEALQAGSEYACALPPPIQSLLIRISNTGVEISSSELPRVFDKFYRIPNQDPWRYGGTGLGLALAKRMAEYLGGRIEVESSNNTTCFTLSLGMVHPASQ